jgi:hypothetical protein
MAIEGGPDPRLQGFGSREHPTVCTLTSPRPASAQRRANFNFVGEAKEWWGRWDVGGSGYLDVGQGVDEYAEQPCALGEVPAGQGEDPGGPPPPTPED